MEDVLIGNAEADISNLQNSLGINAEVSIDADEPPCGTCHLVNGVGTAVGPGMTRIAMAVGPRALAITIEMTMTAYVQQVKTAKSTFSAIQKNKQGDKIEIWDWGQIPPVLKTLSSNEVLSMQAMKNGRIRLLPRATLLGNWLISSPSSSAPLWVRKPKSKSPLSHNMQARAA